MVEGRNSKSKTTAAETLEISLVVLNCDTGIARSSNDMGTAWQETFEDLNENGTLPDACDKGILVLECRAGRCNLV